MSRVVIDIDVQNAVRVYVERWGDERLLNVATTLRGVDISYLTRAEVEAAEAAEPDGA